MGAALALTGALTLGGCTGESSLNETKVAAATLELASPSPSPVVTETPLPVASSIPETSAPLLINESPRPRVTNELPMMPMIKPIPATVQPLTAEQLKLMEGITMRPECKDVQLDLVSVPYIDLQGGIRAGSLVVSHEVSQDVKSIFEELYDIKFPMKSVTPLEHYMEGTLTMSDAQDLDNMSMNDNNTSAFNCRYAVGGDGNAIQGKLSKHALGKAVDINPVFNPYFIKNSDGKTDMMPARSRDLFVENPSTLPGSFTRSGEMGKKAVEIFRKHGWKWGGDFAEAPDTQHFYKD